MTPKTVIITERLIIRHWKDDDSEPFIEMNSDPQVMKYFPDIMSKEQTFQFVSRITQHFEEHGYGLFAVQEKACGEFIGFIGFSHPRFESYFTPCVEIGWRLCAKYWGKGLATEGARACLEYGFTTLNFDKVYSFTAVPNIPSVNVMKKIGLKHIGEFNHPMLNEESWLSRHLLYCITVDEWEANN